MQPRGRVADCERLERGPGDEQLDPGAVTAEAEDVGGNSVDSCQSDERVAEDAEPDGEPRDVQGAAAAQQGLADRAAGALGRAGRARGSARRRRR